jgi:hypothetical protein
MNLRLDLKSKFEAFFPFSALKALKTDKDSLIGTFEQTSL